MKPTRIAVLALGLLAAALPVRARPAAGASPAQVETEYGDAWAELGNWPRAMDHYRKALALEPGRLRVRVHLAQGLHATGRDRAAAAQLARLTGAACDPPTAVAAGRIWLELDRTAEACAAFERVLAARPDHGPALLAAGRCRAKRFADSGDPAEQARARAHLRAYLAARPEGPLAQQAREALEVIELGEPGTLLARAREALAAGRIARAEALLRRVIASQPDLAEAHYLLGMLLADPTRHQPDQARRQWELAGDHPQALLQLGIWDLEADRIERARDRLQRAVALAPELVEAHYQLGLVYLELQSLADTGGERWQRAAVASFGRVAELAPDSPLGERATAKLRVLTGELRYLTEGDVLDQAAELELGQRLSDKLERQFGLLTDRRLAARLEGILEKIIARSDRLPFARPRRIKILKVDGINALGLTGGTIYLYQGLVDFVRTRLGDSDDVYAAIIGHELVHLDRRHGQVLLGLMDNGQSLLEARSINVRSLDRLRRGIGRQHEFEADLIGSLYAYRAGFDPAAALRFHREMIADGHEVPEGLDHPTHAERATRLREYLLGLRAKVRHFDRGLRQLERGNYDLAVRHLQIFLGLFPSNPAAQNDLAVALHRRALQVSALHQPYKLSTDVDPDRRIPPLRLRGPAEAVDFAPDRALMQEAVDLFRDVLRRDPAYLPAALNLGASLLALGRRAEASRLFERVLATAPDSPAAANDLAVALLLDGRPQRAAELLTKLLAARPGFADAHFNLARAMQSAGRAAEALRHYRAYLDSDPDSGWARLARLHLSELKGR